MCRTASSDAVRKQQLRPKLHAYEYDRDSITAHHPPPANMFVTLISIVSCLLVACSIGSVTALANCPIACECDDSTLVVRCGEGTLDVLPIALNPSIQRLIIKNNKIKTIDSALQFYAELGFLDLSYNHLFNIPPGTFNYQRKLRELHLNHNKIGSISNSTFGGLASLTVLNLHGNFLDELGGGVFATLPKLEALNIGQNRITRIDGRAFYGLASLRVLYLDDNSLTAIPSDAFAHVPHLAELHLGFNSFTAIADGSFRNLRALNQLRLNSASLFNITGTTFVGLENVRILDLSDNRLHRIPTAELAALVRLEELSLGQNDFTVVPDGAFAGITNLRRLDISGSLKLQQVQAGAFASNTNVEAITIAANKALTEVQEGAFSGLPHLRHIVLRDNALTTLAEGVFTWADLQTLDVSENPLQCDCRLVWLRNLLMNTGTAVAAVSSSSRNDSQPVPAALSFGATSTALSEPECAAPQHLLKKHLRELTIDELGCEHSDPQRQAIIGVILVGVAAFVTALLLVSYKCRKQIRELLKGRWGNSALGRKEREYQKTFSDEEYMARSKQPPSSLSVHNMGANCTTAAASNNIAHNATAMSGGYAHHHSGAANMRPIPVTEL